MDSHLFQERVLDTLEEHGKQLTDIRVTLAEKYVTKDELAAQRKESATAKRFAITSIIAVIGMGISAFLGVI